MVAPERDAPAPRAASEGDAAGVELVADVVELEGEAKDCEALIGPLSKTARRVRPSAASGCWAGPADRARVPAPCRGARRWWPAWNRTKARQATPPRRRG